jgi:catechol 2,3-dioxygenase-like lactoylglutathione lyase family enzyme
MPAADAKSLPPLQVYNSRMSVTAIDHINIAGPAELIERCRAFYVDVLGLENGHRPPFRSRGFWLYGGGQALVHLTEGDKQAAEGSASLDHFAFRCDGLEETLARFAELGVQHQVDSVPGEGPTQLFLRDPAGVGIELNFPASPHR